MKNFGRIVCAVAAPVALFAMSPASAATVLNPSVTFNGLSGSYGATIEGAGAFSAPFQFSVPAIGKAGVSISSVSLNAASAIQDLTISLNGTTYPVTRITPQNPGMPFVYKFGGFSHAVAAGIQNLVIAGSTSVNSSFSGTIGFTAAVPEPASWALMIGGFGLIGGVMRRRARADAGLAAIA